MVLKMFKVVWFLSLLTVLAVFLFIYASLQETVVIQDGEQQVVVTREGFFYIVLLLLSIINVIVFVFQKLYKKDQQDFLSWIFGLIIVINIFFVIALNYVNLYNSNEKFDFSRLGSVIYGSVALILLWTIGWPVYALYRKFSNKESA